jgi:transposase
MLLSTPSENPAKLMLTAGQIHDLACARDLIENANPEALIADKAYDADPLIDSLAEREITPVIPPKANRKTKRDCDFALYREHNLTSASSTRLSTSRHRVLAWFKSPSNFWLSCPLAWVTSYCRTSRGSMRQSP